MQGKLWRNTLSKFAIIPEESYVCSGHFMDGQKSNFPHELDYFPRFHLPPSIKFPIIKIVKNHPNQQEITNEAKKEENLQENQQNETDSPLISKSSVKPDLCENKVEETQKVCKIGILSFLYKQD